MELVLFKKRFNQQSKKWLILGKGESFDMVKLLNIENYYLATLNDSISYVNNAFFSHFIDFEAFQRNIKYIKKSKYVLIPNYPHLRNKKSKKNIYDLINLYFTHDQTIDLKDRLITYDLNDSDITANFFSSEALFCCLCYLGIKNINFLGLDYGHQYAYQFSSLRKKTLLTNGREDFNQQFAEFNIISKKFSSSLHPLWLDNPMTIYIGCSDSEVLAAKVLEFSINKNNYLNTKIVFLNKFNHLLNKLNYIGSGTPFSLQRYLIPHLMNFEGKALYLDSDMLVFSDLVKLFRYFNETNKPIITTNLPLDSEKESSVMLLDCSKLNWSFTFINECISKSKSMSEFKQNIFGKNVSKIIPNSWNSLDFFNMKTDIIHFTDMPKQPWISTLNKYAHIWFAYLLESINSDFIKKNYLIDEIIKGNIRPSVKYQIEKKIVDPVLIPRNILRMDFNFKMPYVRSVENFNRKFILYLGVYKRNISLLIFLYLGPFFKYANKVKYFIRRFIINIFINK